MARWIAAVLFILAVIYAARLQDAQPIDLTQQQARSAYAKAHARALMGRQP